MIESDTLAASIEKQIKDAVSRSIEDYIAKTLDALVLDDEWVSKVEKLVNQSFVRKFNERISLIDINSLIRDHLDAGIERYRDKLSKNFRSTGIIDSARETELTITDDAVIAEEQLVSKKLLVHQDAEINGSLTVKNLSLKGSINTDNRSWNELVDRCATSALQKMTQEWQQELVKKVLEISKTQGIEFSSIQVGGKQLIDGNALGNNITDSSLEKLGILRELVVKGHTSINDTLLVNNKRIGINTQEPEMALSIWDEEVSVIIGKINKQQAYIGTSRLSNLSIGINRQPQIEIDLDGITTIKQLRVGQHRLGYSNVVPGYSGTRGDLIFNNDPKPGAPFAWVCVGGFKWQALKSA